jgi:CheY-like chemotaxis protein
LNQEGVEWFLYHEKLFDRIMDNYEFKNLKGLRVLVVDDDPFNQKLASYILSMWQVSVETAANGKVALEMLSGQNYDVVLMDLMMPELDGYETTCTLRSLNDPYFRNLPIFAFSTTPDAERVLEYGMNGLVSKSPINKVELHQMISPYLKQEDLVNFS